MPSWSDVTELAPELAEQVRERFDAHGLALLASLTADGSPRLSGVEPLFALGRLWLGMMPGSRKGADLLRDPRLALHNATIDKLVSHGDGKLAGIAVRVDDGSTIAEYRAAFAVATGQAPPPGPMELFEVDVRSLSYLLPADDHLLITSWRTGGSVRTTERY